MSNVKATVTVGLEWVFYAIVATILGMTLWGKMTFDDQAPVSNLRLEVLNSPVEQGIQYLTLRVYRDKHRDDCTLTSVRRAQDSDGRWVELPTRVWEGGDVEEEYVDLLIDVRALHVGEYIGTNWVTYHCPSISFNYITEPYRFRVVERGYDGK